MKFRWRGLVHDEEIEKVGGQNAPLRDSQVDDSLGRRDPVILDLSSPAAEKSCQPVDDVGMEVESDDYLQKESVAEAIECL